MSTTQTIIINPFLLIAGTAGLMYWSALSLIDIVGDVHKTPKETLFMRTVNSGIAVGTLVAFLGQSCYTTAKTN
jgi:hypothetical protein